jgi:hypothetical protein
MSSKFMFMATHQAPIALVLRCPSNIPSYYATLFVLRSKSSLTTYLIFTPDGDSKTAEDAAPSL